MLAYSYLYMQTDPETLIFSLVVLIISIIIHEVAHGYAANALGDPTARLAGRLSLNPLRHIDPFGSIIIPALLVLSHSPIFFGYAKPVPYNPYNLRNQRWGEAIVGGAGVGTNLLLASIFGLLTRLALLHGYTAAADAAATVCFVNLFLGLFNLIPFPPLDGYTVLRDILPPRMTLSFRAFEAKLLSIGFFTSIILFLLVFNFVLIGPFDTFVQSMFHLLTGA